MTRGKPVRKTSSSERRGGRDTMGYRESESADQFTTALQMAR